MNTLAKRLISEYTCEKGLFDTSVQVPYNRIQKNEQGAFQCIPVFCGAERKAAECLYENRESGESPERSGHCEQRIIPRCHCVLGA